MIRQRTPQDDALLSALIRKNKSFYKELNEVNKRFFKEELKDELDWYRILLRSFYTMIYEEAGKVGLVASHLIFNEDDVINDGSVDPQNGFKKVYWYMLPENDKVEVQYISVLKNHFKKEVEGVQINGSIATIQTTRDAKESTSAKHETRKGHVGHSAKTRAKRDPKTELGQCQTSDIPAKSNGKDSVSDTKHFIPIAPK